MPKLRPTENDRARLREEQVRRVTIRRNRNGARGFVAYVRGTDEQVCGKRLPNGWVCAEPPDPRPGGGMRCVECSGSGLKAKERHNLWSRRWDKLGERCAPFFEDPAALLDLAQPLAVMAAVVQRCGERWDELDSPAYRKELSRLWRVYLDEKAREDNEKNPGDPDRALASLGEYILHGAEEDDALRQLATEAERFHKASKATWDVKLARENAIPFQHFRGFVLALVVLLYREFENDQETADRIVGAIRSDLLGPLMSGGTGERKTEFAIARAVGDLMRDEADPDEER